MIIELTLKDNSQRLIELRHFSAMDGWDIQREYIEFASSKDREFRRAFTFRVLSYATAKYKENDIPLSTDALIDNHLADWKNVELIFKAVLKYNDIDPETHADRDAYWAKAGGELAVGFIAECSRIIGPTFAALTKKD